MKTFLVPGVVLALAASSGVLAATAHGRPAVPRTTPTAPRTYDVTAGYGDDDYAANLFNPQVLQIHVGDTVRWHSGGRLEPHDVIFAPPATLNALAAHLQRVIPHKAGPPTIEINPELVVPSTRTSYDGSGVAHSGFMVSSSPDHTWSLTFTKAGAYRYYCVIHYDPMHPEQSMYGVVRVLPRPTPAHLYHVESGYDNGTPTQATDVFFPEALTIHAGDTVVWSPGFHTVSFGPPTLLAQLRRTFIAPLPQKAGPPALAFNPRVISPSGGQTYSGMGFVTSGLLLTPKPHTFALTFPKPGVYHYSCLIHPGMDGTITVLPSGQ